MPLVVEVAALELAVVDERTELVEEEVCRDDAAEVLLLLDVNELVGALVILRVRVVHGTEVAHGAPIRVHQCTGGVHEVGIALHVVCCIHPLDHFLEERCEFRLSIAYARVKTELGDPDGAAARHGMSSFNLLLEVVGASILVRVPVNVDKVDLAASAVTHEV